MITTTESPLVNSQMKMLSNGLSYLGLNTPKRKMFLESGACGLMPIVATVEDLGHLSVRILKTCAEPSLRNKTILTSLSAEVLFDCFEVSSSLGNCLKISPLQKLTKDFSDSAAKVKLVGGIILTVCSIDEAVTHCSCAALGEKALLLEKIICVLRAAEITSGTISNASLLISPDSTKVHKTASAASAFFKALGLMILIVNIAATRFTG